METTLTRIQINNWLAETFYKPGFEYRAEYDSMGNVYVRISMEVVDSTIYPVDVTKKVLVGKTCYPPPHVTEKKYFYDWFGRELIGLEIHESKEWFRSFEDGKPFDDPHAHDRRL